MKQRRETEAQEGVSEAKDDTRGLSAMTIPDTSLLCKGDPKETCTTTVREKAGTILALLFGHNNPLLTPS